MAFENVFGNIDFQAPVRADQRQQAILMQAIGQGMAQAQAAKELDMRKQEMDARLAANAMDVTKLAEQGLMNFNLGLPVSPEQAAAVRTMGMKSSDQVYTDPITRETRYIKSGWGNAAGQLGAPMAQNIRGVPTEGMMPVDLNAPQAPMGNIPPPPNPMTMKPAASQEEFDAMKSTYKAGGILQGTPQGNLMEEESRQKLAEATAAEEMKRNMKGLERYNEGQLASANFANRMVETSNIIDGLEESAGKAKTGAAGYAEAVLSALPSMGMTDKLGKGIVKMSATPEQQQYLNAAQNWIRANLRKESGAVIGDQEMIDEYSTYFPTAGDTKEVIQQKAKLRKEAEKGMITMSAGSYQEAFGKKAQAMQNKPTAAEAAAELRRRGLIK